MKALRISDYAAPLHIDEVPVPSPKASQVLVGILAAFVTTEGLDQFAAFR